jgi:hypothetical protein
MVSSIIEVLWRDPVLALGGLMHDGCEAYGHDLPSPMRKSIRVILPTGETVSWDEMDDRMNAVIGEALGLPKGFSHTPEVKAADKIAVSIEKAQIPELQGLGDWGLPPIPSELSGLTCAFWEPQRARAMFLLRYRSLEARIKG